MSESVFEIREYLDNGGKQSNHEIVDITKELEYFQKIGGDKIEAQDAMDEDKQFIRELALMSAKNEENKAKRTKISSPAAAGSIETKVTEEPELKIEDDLDAVFNRLQEQDNESFSSNVSTKKQLVSAAPTSGKSSVKSSSTSKSNGSSGSGWKSGFLSGPAAKKSNKTTVSEPTASDVSLIDSKLEATSLNTLPEQTNNEPLQKSIGLTNRSVASSEQKKAVSFEPPQSSAKSPSQATEEVDPEEQPVDNIFSQKKTFLQGASVRAKSSGGVMLPLPKIPKGEKTAIAFNGTVMERVYIDETKK